jgi:hypothetical protein
MTVVELNDRLTPSGLALELQLLVVDNWSFASWLFEDGRVVRIVEVARA